LEEGARKGEQGRARGLTVRFEARARQERWRALAARFGRPAAASLARSSLPRGRAPSAPPLQSALITQQRKEDAAGNKVERAQTRASAAQNDFNRFVARKGGPSSGLSLPTLGGGQQQQDGQYGSTDSQGPQLLGRGPILPFLP
jgi:hypothetical protein